MSKKRIKQYLMLLTVIGLVSIASGSSTFASFSAETTNPGNTFAAGTLFLHDTPNGGTTCTSESRTNAPFNVNPGNGGGGGNGNNCTALFTANLAQGATTANIALANAGSLASTDLQFDFPSCSWGDNFANTGTHTTFITPPVNCNGVYFTIQETDSTYTVPANDVYCAFGPSSAPHTDCSPPDNTATVGGIGNTFTQVKTTGGANATLDAQGGATPTRYYVIKVDPSSVGSGNALQNLALTFSMSFHIDH
jgi:predicted ribosomally synthesized peptide with SipW-like signal peptide